MRKHRIPGIALAAVVAGGFAISRPHGTGTALASAVIAQRSTIQHATVRTASNVVSVASSAPTGGWRNVAQRLTFTTDGAITTTSPRGHVVANNVSGQAQARVLVSSAAIVDSTAVAVQGRLEMQAAFIAVVRQEMLQVFIAGLVAQKALEDQQLAAANAARQAAARQAAAAAAAAAAPASGGVWASLRNCESGGNYADNTGNGYYGAYQFSLSTWQGLGYPGTPDQASPATQDAAAAQLQARSGWGQWPACSRMLGLL